MPFDASKGTFAVSLHFDDNSSIDIATVITEIAEVTMNRFITDNHIPPHITLGAFHVNMMEVPRLMQLVEDFSHTLSCGKIQFSGISDFEGRVLFAKPVVNDYLRSSNAALHELLIPEFEKGENGYYLPEVWHPHCTLGTRLSKRQFAKATEIAGKIQFPFETKVIEMSVFQCHPFAEAGRFKLKD